MIRIIDEVVERPPKNVVPDLVLATGDDAVERFQDLFTTQIENDKTRAAYLRAAQDFMAWCLDQRLRSLLDVQPIHVETWLNELRATFAFSTIKLRLTGLRHIFHWLVTGNILPLNPAAAVRGPRRMVRKCRTTVLSAAEVRALMESISGTSPVDLRDKALIGLMLYSFAWVDSILEMKLGDVFIQNRRLKMRLCAKLHDMPSGHAAADLLHAYIGTLGTDHNPKSPLFRAIGRNGGLTRQSLSRASACDMVRCRMEAVGIKTTIGNQSFRATGITVFRNPGRPLESHMPIVTHL